MEALAAVSLAGNVLQFIEFGLKIVSGANAIKRSHDGTLKDHEELKEVIGSFETHIQKLNDRADLACPHLRDLIDQGQALAVEFIDALHTTQLKDKRNVWTSIKKALQIAWTQRELNEREKRLTRLQNAVSLHVQMQIKDHADNISKVLDDLSSRVQLIETNLKVLSHAQKTNFERLQEALDQPLTALIHEVAQQREMIDFQTRSKVLRSLCDDLTRLHDSLRNDNLQATIQSLGVVSPSDFLETLSYRMMTAREDSIPESHLRTFKWLLMDTHQVSESSQDMTKYQAERNALRNDVEATLMSMGADIKQIQQLIRKHSDDHLSPLLLQDWLSQGDGIFWIRGKPASGKSTIMKAMLGQKALHDRIHELLGQWSGSDRLVIASYYFYRPGTMMQKTHAGLLRSLIYQILRQTPQYVSEAFTDKEQRLAITRARTIDSQPEQDVWSILELKTAFMKLQTLKGIRIYLHIDGIDEMIGQGHDIADILAQIVNNPGSNTKALISGRWSRNFELKLGLQKSICLHELTELDILKFCADKLNCQHIMEVLEDPRSLITILREILGAAEGVFLWVRIVVDSLCEGAAYYESFSELHDRLRQYPSGLDELYQFLLDDIDVRYRAETASWILLVAAPYVVGSIAPRLISLSELQVAESIKATNPAALLDVALGKITARPKQDEILRKKMIARCRHFFLSDWSWRKNDRLRTVSFSHRTLYDFSMQNDVLDKLLSLIRPSGDVLTRYLLAIIASKLASRLNGLIPMRASIEGLQGIANIFADAYAKIPRLEEHFGGTGSELFTKQVTHFLAYIDHHSQDKAEYWPYPEGWRIETRITHLSKLCNQEQPVHVLSMFGDSYAGSDVYNRQKHDSETSHDDTKSASLCRSAITEYLAHFRRTPRCLTQWQNLSPFLAERDQCSWCWSQALVILRVEFHDQMDAASCIQWIGFNIIGRVWRDVFDRLPGMGADVRVPCLSVFNDPDKAQLSASTLLKRIIDKIRTMKADPALKELHGHMLKVAEFEILELVQQLIEDGCEEEVIPFEEHQDEGVLLLD